MGYAEQIEGIIAKGQLVPLVFMQDALAASQADVQLKVAEVASAALNAVEGITMPFDGEVVAVTADLDTAGSAGTLTAGATVNGTEDADTTLTVTTQTSKTKKVTRGLARFRAGAVIGAEITTSGTWNGTTSDLVVVVWVLLSVEGV